MCQGHRAWPGEGALRSFHYQLPCGWTGEGLLASPASSEPFQPRLFQTPPPRPEDSLSSSVLGPFRCSSQTWARPAAFLSTQALPSRTSVSGGPLGPLAHRPHHGGPPETPHLSHECQTSSWPPSLSCATSGHVNATPPSHCDVPSFRPFLLTINIYHFDHCKVCKSWR